MENGLYYIYFLNAVINGDHYNCGYVAENRRDLIDRTDPIYADGIEELPEMLTFTNEEEALKFAEKYADMYFNKFDGKANYGRVEIRKL